MTADESPHGDAGIPSSARRIETGSPTAKETILVVFEELILPEKVGVENILIKNYLHETMLQYGNLLWL